MLKEFKWCVTSTSLKPMNIFFSGFFFGSILLRFVLRLYFVEQTSLVEPYWYYKTIGQGLNTHYNCP